MNTDDTLRMAAWRYLQEEGTESLQWSDLCRTLGRLLAAEVELPAEAEEWSGLLPLRCRCGHRFVGAGWCEWRNGRPHCEVQWWVCPQCLIDAARRGGEAG